MVHSTNLEHCELGAIWAQSTDGVIGDGSAMPWRLPEDLTHFKNVTMGSPVVMGRKTWDSLPPNFRPLPGRDNFILSSRPEGSWSEGATVLSSFEDIPEHSWIIGGGTIYDQLVEHCTCLEVTVVDVALASLGESISSPVFAPDIPDSFELCNDSGWQDSEKGTLLPGFSSSTRDPEQPLRYRFCSYTRT